MESILETQVLCIVALFNYKNEYTIDDNMSIIMVLLLIEHILSYISDIYRAHEIKHHGQPDVNGVYRAKYESMMRTI